MLILLGLVAGAALGALTGGIDSAVGLSLFGGVVGLVFQLVRRANEKRALAEAADAIEARFAALEHTTHCDRDPGPGRMR